MPQAIIGKPIVDRYVDEFLIPLRDKIIATTGKLKQLAVVITQATPEINIYITAKERFFRDLRLPFQIYEFSPRLDKLQEQIDGLNRNPSIGGIIVQLPLHSDLTGKEQQILDLIAPNKDVEGLTSTNQARLVAYGQGMLSPAVAGIFWMLRYLDLNWKSKIWGIVGAGLLIGRPLVLYLTYQKVSYSTIDLNNPSYELLEKADIVVFGTGHDLSRIIADSRWSFKDDAVLFDAGTRLEGENIHSDLDLPIDMSGVDYKENQLLKKIENVAYYTPYKKSLGVLTVFSLAYNFLTLQARL